MPGLNGVLAIGVPIYTILLTTMAWRAISRVQFFGVNLYNNIEITEPVTLYPLFVSILSFLNIYFSNNILFFKILAAISSCILSMQSREN